MRKQLFLLAKRLCLQTIYYNMKRVLAFQRTHPLLKHSCTVDVLKYGIKRKTFSILNVSVSKLFLPSLGEEKSFVPLDLRVPGKFCGLAIYRSNNFACHANVNARFFANAKVQRWKDHGDQ